MDGVSLMTDSAGWHYRPSALTRILDGQGTLLLVERDADLKVTLLAFTQDLQVSRSEHG